MLEKINCPSDIKKLDIKSLENLCSDIRETMMYRLSRIGGHLGSNMGIVECTVAMHYVFDSPSDKIVFDVSHQCYAHKIITGRKYGFNDEKRFKEISGFTNPEESVHDQFLVGHTSTSVSLAQGICIARDFKGENYNVIAVIGDGSLSGGEAMEGLDFAGEYDGNFIIVVNDNNMSIAENHGGIYKNLKELRESNGNSANNIFKAIGLDYVFLKDGNDIEKLIKTFSKVKNTKKPIVVHICTEKGSGYEFAEKNKEQWHWHMPFDEKTGESTVTSSDSYVEIAREFLLDFVKKDEKSVIVCAGTPGAIGFYPQYRKIAGKHFIDVGIAEEHAVAMTSAMAKNGLNPIFCVQSSFVQRCYDQISQDLSLNKSPAVIFVYSSGIRAMRDVTHIGLFDMAMMGSIPGVTCLSPVDKDQFRSMAEWAVKQKNGPVVIRIPTVKPMNYGIFSDYNGEIGSQIVKRGKDVAVFALGNHYEIGVAVCDLLKERGIDATLINPCSSNTEKQENLDNLLKNHSVFVTIEDGVLSGGYGEMIGRMLNGKDCKILNYGYKKQFEDRFVVEDILRKNGMDAMSVADDIVKLLKK